MMNAFELHEHDFERNDYKKQFTCDGCKEEGFGVRYVCAHCGYELHEECRLPKQILPHEFFKSSSFRFFEKPQISCGDFSCTDHIRCCDACGKDILGFNYHCVEEGWDLHPCCSNLNKEVRIDGMIFELRDKMASSKKCMSCDQRTIFGGSKKIPGWSYVSRWPECRFHVYCVKKMAHRALMNEDKLALQKIDLKELARGKKKGKSESALWKTIKVFLQTLLSILLGDPTMLLATGFVELITRV